MYTCSMKSSDYLVDYLSEKYYNNVVKRVVRNLSMTQEQLDLMNELEVVIAPILERHIRNKNLTVADVVYCTMSQSEEIALRVTRHMRKESTQ